MYIFNTSKKGVGSTEVIPIIFRHPLLVLYIFVKLFIFLLNNNNLTINRHLVGQSQTYFPQIIKT